MSLFLLIFWFCNQEKLEENPKLTHIRIPVFLTTENIIHKIHCPYTQAKLFLEFSKKIEKQ